jgi:hypothetical protein
MNAITDARYAAVRQRLDQTYRWLPADRPPLQVVTSGQGGLTMPSFTASLADPTLLFEHQVSAAESVRDIGSDSIPVLVPVPNSAVLVPSMYGAEVVEAESVWARPLGASLAEMVDGLHEPPLDAGLMPAFERNVRYFVENAPDWAHVCSPIPHEGLESAVYLRGQALFTEMFDDEARLQALLAALTSTHVATTQRIKRMVGEPPDRMVSHKGTYMPATRIACDSVVNLSPAMLRRFFLPHVTRLAGAIGTRIHLHYCSIAGNPAAHVPAALSACEAISGLSTMAPTFAVANDPPALQQALAGRFAMTVDLPALESAAAFAAWANELAQRWLSPTGVIARIVVRSVDEGRARMDAWRAAWRTQS